MRICFCGGFHSRPRLGGGIMGHDEEVTARRTLAGTGTLTGTRTARGVHSGRPFFVSRGRESG